MQADANKKRVHDEDGDEEQDGYSTSSSYAPSAIDVSFDYVGPSEIDFAALKRLVQQLYHTHAPDMDIGALADHIIKMGQVVEGDAAPPAVGTVVKVEDDEDSDPFAFASAVELSGERASAEAASATLRTYYSKQLGTSASPSAKAIWSTLSNTSNHVVQLFHERMINLPPQIMLPLYRMLLDEVRAHPSLRSASHFLLFSRVFSTDALSDDEDGQASSNMLAPRSSSGAAKKAAKKGKKAVVAAAKNHAITTVAGTNAAADGLDANEVGLFHPEDALFAKYALHTHTFRFPAVKDSDDSFNAPMFGRVVLLKNDKDQLKALLDEMAEAFAMPAEAA